MKQLLHKAAGFLLSLLFVGAAAAQDKAPVQFSFSQQRISATEVLLKVKAVVKPGAQLYAARQTTADAPYSYLEFDSSTVKKLKDTVTESSNFKTEKDAANNNIEVRFFGDTAYWEQKLTIAAADSFEITGKAVALVKEGDAVNVHETPVEVFVKADPGYTSVSSGEKKDVIPVTPSEKKSLWLVFFEGLLAGLAAFIMPCIYAMLPTTVSFFTKRSTDRKSGIRNAFLYSMSIVVIFTLLGVLLALLKNPTFINDLANSAWFNLFVFAMFIVFGISFLGAFEITLPASWTNAISSKAGTSGIGGIFFMALTLAIVSFSCTVPFLGGLAVLTSKGEFAAPVIGFMAFGLAIALPFAFFALFPGLMSKMAKGGGWFNTVKVTLGFVELALALKFLSNVDLAYHWRLLDREVYLALWIAIFSMLGLYLLGKIRLGHDDELPKNSYGVPHISITRLFFAIANFAFVIYMIPGLWGAPLKGISAWLPEVKTQDFNLYKMQLAGNSGNNAAGEVKTDEPRPVKYADFLGSEIPGVTTFFDYDEAIAAAKQLNRPILLDFTGHNCANCRKMEQEVLSDAQIIKRLQNDFVVVSLYVDDKYRLPPAERYISTINGNEIKNLGDKNLDFEITLTSSNSQPQYVFVGLDGKIIQNAGGYNSDINRFIKILDDVKAAFHKK
jgi:thiol:disulfide interchange protein